MIYKRIAWLLLLPALTGCPSVSVKTHKLYDGPTLNDNQVAAITSTGGMFSIDNEEYKGTRNYLHINQVQVLPGHYVLKHACKDVKWPHVKTFWIDLPITVEAGKSYEIRDVYLTEVIEYESKADAMLDGMTGGRHIKKQRKLFVWVEEVLSGKVITGYRPIDIQNENSRKDIRYKTDFKKGYGHCI